MIRNRSYEGKKVWARGGAVKHATLRGSCPPGGHDHEDTAGGAIPHKPETDAEVDIRQVAQNFALDRADG